LGKERIGEKRKKKRRTRRERKTPQTGTRWEKKSEEENGRYLFADSGQGETTGEHQERATVLRATKRTKSRFKKVYVMSPEKKEKK